jgi:hypothetical protein
VQQEKEKKKGKNRGKIRKNKGEKGKKGIMEKGNGG